MTNEYYLYNHTYEERKEKILTFILHELSMNGSKNKSAVLDATAFINHIYNNATPKSLNLHYEIQTNEDSTNIVLIIKNEIFEETSLEKKQVVASFIFFGDGQWGYKIKIEGANYLRKFGLKDKGERLNSHTQGESEYLFTLDYEPEQSISIKEHYLSEYHPIFTISNPHKLRLNDVSAVKILWETDHYDGMLAGFCSINKKTYYFFLADQQTYSKKRMFTIFKISKIHELQSRLRHFLWDKALSVFPAKLRSFLWFKILRHATFIKPEHLKRGGVLGYFEY